MRTAEISTLQVGGIQRGDVALPVPFAFKLEQLRQLLLHPAVFLRSKLNAFGCNKNDMTASPASSSAIMTSVEFLIDFCHF